MIDTNPEVIDGAASRGMPVPDVILEAVVEAISNHELSLGLSDDQIKSIGVEAVHEGTLDDHAWLEERLISIRTELENMPNTEELEKKITGFEEELAQIQVTSPQHVESQDQLNEIVRLHEVWMESVVNPSKDPGGSRANFEGMDLSGLDLSHKDLSCANFRNSSLVGTNFTGAKLSRATFTGADLQGANFSGAKVKRADFENALLNDIDYDDANFRGSNFTGTVLEGKTLDKKSTPPAEEVVDPFMMI